MVMPGAMLFTRTRGASDRAALFARLIRSAFAAA